MYVCVVLVVELPKTRFPITPSIYRFDRAVALQLRMFQLHGRKAAKVCKINNTSQRPREKQQVHDLEVAPLSRVEAHLASTNHAFEIFKSERLRALYDMFGGKDAVERRVADEHQQKVRDRKADPLP